jgi:hypothetical protein
MPFELRRAEKVLWIFNDAKMSARTSTSAVGEIPPINGSYFCKDDFSERWTGPEAGADRSVAENRGDLVLTSYNLCFVSISGQHSRIPLSRITGIKTYANAVDVGYGSKPPRAWMCTIPDPWFFANAIAYRHRAIRPPQADLSEFSTSAAKKAPRWDVEAM